MPRNPGVTPYDSGQRPAKGSPMRVLRMLLATMLAAGALAVFSGPAGAVTPTTDVARFCDAADSVGDDLDNVNPGNLGDLRDNVDQLKDQLEDAAQYAPKKVKKALSRIVDYFDAIGDLSSGDLSSGDLSNAGNRVKRFTKSLVTYSTYVSRNC